MKPAEAVRSKRQRRGSLDEGLEYSCAALGRLQHPGY